MYEELIPLELIHPNPWQPRTVEDAEHIKALALSIASEGLLQKPVGRWKDERVELAFGHSRLAAFRWLLETQPDDSIVGGWDEMPMIIRVLDDEDMFRLAVSENVQRRELSPVEEARAMKRYRDEFNKNSKEIGDLFGLNESTIRNKMRLVELPEKAQAALQEGKLTEGGARRLLTVGKILPAEEVDRLAEEIANGDYTKPEQVDNTIRTVVSAAKTSQKLYSVWQTYGEKRAGDYWPLDWDTSGLEFPLVTFGQFKKCYDGAETVTIRYPSLMEGGPERDRAVDLKEIFEYASLNVTTGMSSEVTRRVAEAAPEAEELVRQLNQPPACSKCPLHVVLAGDGFCGRKVCFERKKEVWLRAELARVSNEMAIPIYDPETDGKYYQEYVGWGALGDWFRRELAEKSAHLRVRSDIRYENQGVSGSKVVQIISVDPKHIEQARRRDESEQEAEAKRAEREAESLKKTRLANASHDYLTKEIAPVVGDYLYGGLPDGALAFLLRNRRGKIEDNDKRLAYLALLGYDAINGLVEYHVMTAGPAGVRKFLLGVAKEIGLAAEHLPGVSMETEEV